MLASGVAGVILAIAGFAYGIAKFSTFSRDNVDSFRMAHAVLGTIATVGAMVQALLLVVMRKPRYNGEPSSEWPMWQKIGQFTHCYLGWLWIAFGLVACETGTHMTSVTDARFEHLGLDRQDEIYTGGFIGALLATAVVTASVVTWHNMTTAGGAIAPEPKNNDKQNVEAPPAAAFEKCIEIPPEASPEKEIDLDDPMEDVNLEDMVKEQMFTQ